MKKILPSVFIYLLIGCVVTCGFLTHRRSGRDDIGAVVGIMFVGPFIWPALALQMMASPPDDFTPEFIKKLAEQRIAACPPGFEVQCREFYRADLLNRHERPEVMEKNYAEFLTQLAERGLPDSPEGRAAVLDISIWYGRWYGNSRKLAKLEQDITPLLNPDAGFDRNLAGATLLQGTLPDAQDVEKFLWLYSYAENGKIFGRLLNELIPIYERICGLPDSFTTSADIAGGEPLCLSSGLGSLYEVFAHTRAGAERSFWVAKAQAQYAAVALRRQWPKEGVSALYDACRLAETDAQRLALVRAVFALRFEGVSPPADLPDCLPVPRLWWEKFHGAPGVDGSVEKGGFLDAFWALFADAGPRIEATRYLIPLSIKPDTSRMFEERNWRFLLYDCYLQKNDPRWLDIVLPVLAHTVGYEEKRLFYEAENAWIRGDTEKSSRLLDEYRRSGGRPGEFVYERHLFLDRDFFHDRREKNAGAGESELSKR